MKKVKKVFKGIQRVIVRGVLYFYCKIAHRAKIIGLENIPKGETLIFCGNHRTYLDPPLMVATCRKNIRFMAKEDLKSSMFLSYLGYVFDAIYVKRDSKDVSALKATLKALKNGECIALFPEGTRNGLEKGEKVKDGAAFFAVRSGAKVIPCGISGGTGAFDKVTIKYGKPLDFSGYTDVKDKEALDKVTEEIMNNILELAK